MNLKSEHNYEFLNDFAIKSGGYIHTCVPESFWFKSKSVALTQSSEWSEPDSILHVGGNTEELLQSLSDRHIDRSYTYRHEIHLHSSFSQYLYIFNKTLDEIQRFEPAHPVKIIIVPADNNEIGGTYSASSGDGISFSGHHPVPPPECGLMAKESGLLTAYYSDDSSTGDLELRLPLGTLEFSRLEERLLASLDSDFEVNLRVTIELFEEEIQAAVGYESSINEFAIIGTESAACTHARLDYIHLSISSVDTRDHSKSQNKSEQKSLVKKIWGELRANYLGVLLLIGIFAAIQAFNRFLG